MRGQQIRIKQWLLVTLVILCTTASADAQKRGLVELRSLEPLKAAFQRDSDKVRLVTLLSPT